MEQAPAAAASLFGDRLDVAEAYATLLTTDGIAHGLIGPREADRIWTRHLLNCAVVTELIPASARVVDVGSGAGLPGLVLAIRRPDLTVQLVEPLLRRATFLTSAVSQLGLTDQVTVVRGRAEEGAVRRTVGGAPVVIARAVAPLDRLVGWCMPLLAPGCVLLALKGSSAADEVREHRQALARAGARDAEVVECGADQLEQTTAVVRVTKPKGPR